MRQLSLRQTQEAFSVYAIVYTVDFHWEVNGWLTIDINTEQIDWKKADDEMQAAKVVFVEKDKKSDFDEISTELKLTGMNNK